MECTEFAELVAAARTCRRFQGDRALGADKLASLVDLARISPCARNLQTLRYVTIHSQSARDAVFAMITLGAALRPEQRATAKQSPGGYIVILGPAGSSGFTLMDVGIAAQTINLGAAKEGLACCMVGSFHKERLTALISPPEGLEPLLLLALGAPGERRRLEALPSDGSVTYFRDAADVHCVPKRPLDAVLLAAF